MLRKLFFLLISVSVCSPLYAAIPDVIITTTNAYNGYATVAGRLTTKPEEPVGVTVMNGNIAYATVTDPDGRWGIVVRQISIHIYAQSFSLSRKEERGALLKVALR